MDTETPSRQMMYAQIVSQPALFLEVFSSAEALIHHTLARFQVDQWRAVYMAGCGDSFYAGLACEMAFARFCRLPVKALPAMQFARRAIQFSNSIPMRANA
jgi:glucosamine 6-phosphate synthetase-like amidotransferase/phosphosugar isomerase protein